MTKFMDIKEKTPYIIKSPSTGKDVFVMFIHHKNEKFPIFKDGERGKYIDENFISAKDLGEDPFIKESTFDVVNAEDLRINIKESDKDEEILKLNIREINDSHKLFNKELFNETINSIDILGKFNFDI